MELYSNRNIVLVRRRRQGCIHRKEGSCEGTARRWSLESQGERPQEKLNMLTP